MDTEDRSRSPPPTTSAEAAPLTEPVVRALIREEVAAAVAAALASSSTSRPQSTSAAGPSSPLLTLSNLVRDHHRYTADLLALEQASPAPIAIPDRQTTQSPLDPAVWQQCLQSYPDREFAQFIVRGLRGGFRIGVRRGAQLKPSARNLKSAYEQPQVVQAYLDREVQLGRLHQRPCSDSARIQGLQISHLESSPKGISPTSGA